jgi:hypothetical protein
VGYGYRRLAIRGGCIGTASRARRLYQRIAGLIAGLVIGTCLLATSVKIGATLRDALRILTRR